MAVSSAMLAAVCCVLTLLIRIPVFNGYIHPGDSVIYIASCLLPLPYCALCGAIGATLADILSGGIMWAPWTFVIKIILSLLFTRKGTKIISPRNLAGCVLCAAVTVSGYYIAELVIYGNAFSPLISAFWNLIQAVVSAAIFIAVGFIFDKLRLKDRFTNSN